MTGSTEHEDAIQEEPFEPTILLDARRVAREYGINLATAYRIMRRVGCIDLTDAGIKKLYVRRADLEKFLDASTELEP